MNILDTLKQLRDDIKAWATNNFNALNAKIDEKTIPIDNQLDSSSTNPVQNKVITNAINNIPRFSGDYNDLTNAPNITEDDSGNMVIADESGNVIFKADADGIHTTAVSLNGEAAASEKYVDEAIANIGIPDVDFAGYATEDYVTSVVDSAKQELSESIVAESNEWKVVDEASNIIFSVDATGAHTTSLTLDGESIEDMINSKIDKVDGKGLSTNDFTNEYKNKLDNLNGTIKEEDPTVPAWAKEPTKPTYSKAEVGLGNVDNIRQYSENNPPPYPVTSINGNTGAVVLDAASVGAERAMYITPEMYNAKGDGTTDDSDAIQSAINAAKNNGVVYLGKKTYKISKGLEISGVNYPILRCDGDIVYDGTGAAITLSNTRRANIDINVLRAPNGTALLFDTTDGEVTVCNVNIRYITGSKIGVHLRTGGGGAGHNIFYNKFHIEGEIRSSEKCIYIEPTTALVNENFFWLGRLFGSDSDSLVDKGIVINGSGTFAGADVNGNASRNVFFCGDMEGVSGCGIELHNTNGNVFRDFRFEEAYGTKSVVMSGECFANELGMSMVNIDEVDITGLVSSNYNKYYNVIRSPKIRGYKYEDITEVLASYGGFTCERDKAMAETVDSLNFETWTFTMEDGSIVEKKVVIL